MKRLLLVTGLVLTSGVVALEVTGTFAGMQDDETAAGSFRADLCHERPCEMIHAHGLDDHDCNEDEWRFVITSVDAETAPRSIHVNWSGGDASVGLDRVTGSVAQYGTSSYLDQQVEDAQTRLPEDWSGEFNLGEGPCQG